MRFSLLVRLTGAAALAAGCAGNAVTTSVRPSAPAATAIAAPEATEAPPTTAVAVVRFDETLTLADGRKLKARCVGKGTPTILLEVGGSGDMGEWQPQFVNELGTKTTTCLYSRAGGRGSTPLDGPPTMADVTGDAFRLLGIAKEKAGVDGPFLFVGWSLGGSVALGEALTRPDQTVGVAILDTDFPLDFLPFCAAQGRTKSDCQAEYDGDIDARLMESQIARKVRPLDIPAILITAMAYPECVDTPGATLSASISGATLVAGDCAGLATAIADKQLHDWPAAFPRIVQTRIDADHDGLLRAEGRRIAQLIFALVDRARGSS
jgi:pimeloyl-ACP methyl ester carboxylesterase